MVEEETLFIPRNSSVHTQVETSTILLRVNENNKFSHSDDACAKHMCVFVKWVQFKSTQLILFRR